MKKQTKKLTLREKVLGAAGIVLLGGASLVGVADSVYTGRKASDQEATVMTYNECMITPAGKELENRMVYGYVPTMLLGAASVLALTYSGKNRNKRNK